MFSRDYHRLDLAPSACHSVLIVFGHGIALLTLLVGHAVPFGLCVALAFSVVVSCVYSLDRFSLLNHKWAVQGLLFDRGNWQLHLKNGTHQDAELLMPLYVSQWFVVLRFRSQLWTTAVVVARDSTDPDAFRRTLVFLRHGIGHSLAE